MKTLCILLLVFGSMLSLVACNTVKGLGRDVERTGEAIEDVVD